MSRAWSEPALVYFGSHAIDPAIAASCGVAEVDDGLVYTIAPREGQTFERRRRLTDGRVKVIQPAGVALAPWWLRGFGKTPAALISEGESDGLSALTAIENAPRSLRDGPLDGLAVCAIPGTPIQPRALVSDLTTAECKLAILALDADPAGLKATERLRAALTEVGMKVAILALPDGTDLADCFVRADDPSEWLANAVADAEAAIPVESPPLGAPLVRPEEGHELAGEEPDSPFALPLTKFIASRSDSPAALIGEEDDNLLPVHGLLLLVAKGGKGKTTLAIDQAFHVASGVDWLGFEVSRPLRVLFIENEGPREPFRHKVEMKSAAWPHSIDQGDGGIHVYDQDWGQAKLNAEAFVNSLNGYVANQGIDLIIGDPLDTIGMEGVGSPEDTRNMVERLQSAGLFSTAAWELLHHSRKESVADAVDEASGAWAGKPDTLLVLDKQHGNRARLSFPKVRWSRRGEHGAYNLAFEPDTETFTLLGEEATEERDLVAEIEELLEARGGWLTAKEISAPKEAEDPGVGANADLVKKALQGNPDRFVSRTGELAKEVGRHSNATVWSLTQGSESHESDKVSEGVSSAGVESDSLLKESDPLPDRPQSLETSESGSGSDRTDTKEPEPREAGMRATNGHDGRPDWLDSPTLPEAERQGLELAHRELVETGLGSWEEGVCECLDSVLVEVAGGGSWYCDTCRAPLPAPSEAPRG